MLSKLVVRIRAECDSGALSRGKFNGEWTLVVRYASCLSPTGQGPPTGEFRSQRSLHTHRLYTHKALSIIKLARGTGARTRARLWNGTKIERVLARAPIRAPLATQRPRRTAASVATLGLFPAAFWAPVVLEPAARPAKTFALV